MKLSYSPLCILPLVLSGCLEQATPTSPLLEQAVFNAFGGLQVGESMRFSGAAAAEVLIGTPSVTGEFVYIPYHASRSQGAELQIEIEALSVQTSASSLATSASFIQLDPRRYPSERMHAEFFERQRKSVEAARRRIRPSSIRSRVPAAMMMRPDLSGSNAHVGQLVEINTDTFGDFCTTVVNRTGRVEAISQHAIVVGDIGNPTGGFERSDYEEVGELFDSLVHPTITETFVEPTDIDDNDRVIIFFTRAVNEMTTPEDDGFIGGFFYGRDLFPVEACPASNFGEIFYLLAPDPNREASHIPHSLDRVRNQGIATVAHEFEHLINAGRRIYVNDADALEDAWLDEGLAHIAEELIFYAVADLEPRSNVDLEMAKEAKINDAINRYGIQNLSRYGQYLEDVTGQAPTNSEDNLETRGAAWSFLRYAADQSGLSDEDFFGPLVNTTLTGLENVSAMVDGQALDWFQDWGVSIYTDDRLTVGDALYQQPSWNFRSLLPALFGDFPLDVETLNPGASVDLVLLATTSGFVRVQGVAGSSTRVRTSSGGAAPPPELRVTVVRIE